MYLLFICVIFTLYILYRLKMRNKIKLYEKFKTDIKSWPVIGHGFWFLGTNEDRMNTFKMCGQEAVKNGGIASFWLANNLYLVLADHKIVELVMKTTAEKNEIARFIRMLIGNGILFAPAAIWRPRRKVLAPTFSQKNLNYFVDIFYKQSCIMVEQLEEMVGKGDFPIWKYITCYAMDSVCENTLGYEMNGQTNPDQPFFVAFEKCCRLVVDRMVQPWFYNPLLYSLTQSHTEFMNSVNYIRNFVQKIIENKREELAKLKDKNDISDLEGTKNKFKSFLELLIESSGGDRGYSDIELLEETLVLVLGGTDTSAVGISFTVLMLSRHQDIQEKVYQEILEVFGDSDRPLTHEDIPRLKYLDAAIREALRLYPPVPILIPGLDRNITLPSGVMIPADTGILVNIWAMHHDSNQWGDDVEEYKPERFIDAKPNPSFMPFSTGLRTCIGYKYSMMSLITVLSTLLRRYKLLPSESAKKGIPIRLKYDVMMKDVDSFQVKLEPRKKLN